MDLNLKLNNEYKKGKMMSAKIHLCSKCGDVYYEIDLSETCFGQMVCEDCMVDFMNEQCDQSEI